MTLEAAGHVLAKGHRSGAKGGRPGLRRLWAAASATWCPLTWFVGLWLVPLGNIQVLACNQYLPGGLLSCSLSRDWATRRLLGSHAGLHGLGGLPLAPLPSPRAHAAFLAFWGPPGAGYPPTLGFWRFQSLCVWWRFPFFSLIFKAFIHVNHPTNPQAQLPNQHSSCQR